MTLCRVFLMGGRKLKALGGSLPARWHLAAERRCQHVLCILHEKRKLAKVCPSPAYKETFLLHPLYPKRTDLMQALLYSSACGPFSHLTEKYIIRYTTIDVPGDSCRTPDRKGFSYESD